MSKQVSAADRELLTCLIEECSEVIHAATKTLRHGPDSYNPIELAGPSNEAHLCKELGDAQAIITLLIQRRFVDPESMKHWCSRKMETLGQYLHHSDIRDDKIIPMRKDS